MAYVEPNSTVMLLRHIPLEPDYEHTVRLAAGAQSGAFSAYAKYTISKNTYQRVNRNTFRVGIVADNLYDCNYMMFQNTAFGSKWFYAFITKVNYINNECTEIEYMIDSFQTYAYDYDVGACYVEREHAETDAIGDNIVAEGLECGDYIHDNYTNETDLREMCVLVIDNSGSEACSLIGNGVVGGVLRKFAMSDLTSLRTFLASHLQTPEEILGIYVCPSEFANATNGVVTSINVLNKAYTSHQIHGTESFDGYVPKNKKLYTYPYNFFHLDNGKGSTLNLRYEFFDSRIPRIKYIGSNLQPVEICATPYGYKGTSAGGGLSVGQGLLTEQISISGYPIGSWSNNTWAQQMGVTINNGICGAIHMGTKLSIPYTASTGQKTASAAYHTLNTADDVFSMLAKRDMIPNTEYGNSNGGGALAQSGEMNFNHSRCRITGEYAQIIDNYFTRFGYATNKIKIPNLGGRPHWNYVKTVSCELIATESLPGPDAAIIKNAFNRGITFWKQLSEVGDFTLDNSI